MRARRERGRLFSVIVVDVWQWTPFCFLVFLAALQGIPDELPDMVLLDDNFATIVSAVGEGRTIYDNIRKFVRYTLTSNSGEIWVMFVGPFIGLPLPLLPVQILWINLVTDGLPGLALGIEPAVGEGGVEALPAELQFARLFAALTTEHGGASFFRCVDQRYVFWQGKGTASPNQNLQSRFF